MLISYILYQVLYDNGHHQARMWAERWVFECLIQHSQNPRHHGAQHYNWAQCWRSTMSQDILCGRMHIISKPKTWGLCGHKWRCWEPIWHENKIGIREMLNRDNPRQAQDTRTKAINRQNTRRRSDIRSCEKAERNVPAYSPASLGRQKTTKFCVMPESWRRRSNQHRELPSLNGAMRQTRDTVWRLKPGSRAGGDIRHERTG